MQEKIPVLIIAGPTAVGKTALSIELAQEFKGEIISGDSMQVYKQLDVGTAKVTPEEQAGIPHYCLDIRELTERYSVADFQKLGREQIQMITDKGKLPMVVGGTGLYIQALITDFSLGGKEEKQDHSRRDFWTAFEKEYGKQALWKKLETVDPKAARAIHPNNSRRVIRALEIKETTGKSIVDQDTATKEFLYDVKLIGLTTDRTLLYDRINQRVDLMLASGLLEEARLVYKHQNSQAAQAIGYKEFFPYFEQKASLEECVEQLKKNSRHYAKRQLTWFRNRMTVEWWDLVQYPEKRAELKAEIATWLHNRKETHD